ncbi:MAG: hypothetical protein GY832_12965 [Chloroflexi bacterium]|nr:hypothetical protein [Chloroflexota bacterium]
MSLTRREFVKSMGIAVASLMMARCSPSEDYGDTRPTDPPMTLQSPENRDDSPRNRLRTCWLQLDSLRLKAQKDYEQGSQLRDELGADHQTSLDELVAAGELDAAVADQVQTAFDEAAFHIWRSNAPITCYIALPVEFDARDDLRQQFELLYQITDGLDQATVNKVQTAIERDIAFFETFEDLQVLKGEAYQQAQRELIAQFDSDDVEVSPEAAQAARFLVELLLREQS